MKPMKNNGKASEPNWATGTIAGKANGNNRWHAVKRGRPLGGHPERFRDRDPQTGSLNCSTRLRGS